MFFSEFEKEDEKKENNIDSYTSPYKIPTRKHSDTFSTFALYDISELTEPNYFSDCYQNQIHTSYLENKVQENIPQ